MKYLREPVVLIFWGIGALLLALGGFFGWSMQRVASWPKLTVEVISSQAVPNGNDFLGEVRVKTSQGAEKVLTTSWSSSDVTLIESALAATPVGAQVDLPQNPSDPEDLRLPPGGSDWIIPLALAGAGLLFGVIPIGVMALSDRSDAAALAGLGFMVIGLGLVGVGGIMVFKKVDVLTNWPVAEATVVSNRIVPATRTTLRLQVQCAYTAEGQRVESTLSTRASSRNRSQLEQLAAGSLAVGSHLQVRYRKGSPRVGTFEAAWTFGFFWEAVLVTCGGFLLVGLGALMKRYLGS
ncbi:MAG: DUF3592 domain-containing protein [Candidatus Eremiobacteraeota bacterium]|nr:DUF3592 domain-containing protein [Candidatus Eremiobacteraeota bacterium]